MNSKFFFLSSILLLQLVSSLKMQNSPAFMRNRDPIVDALRQCGVNECDHVLELGCGPGEHIVYIANKLQSVRLFQPTDVSLEALESTNCRIKEARLEDRILPAQQIDIGKPDWYIDSNTFDAAFAINVLHIAPHGFLPNLFREAARCLKANGLLCFYDTWIFDGRFVGPNNERFDQSLRSQGYSGIPNIEQCDAAAEAAGFRRADVLHLPANNQFVTYAKQS
uniref:Methyltransferase domain-containing protein n=1 Tax=Aureoumbra lagunensis TaxID=44058 RepID=A0A7S3NFB7_9STRA|mmetsp:Transcript_1235/g.1560  ORF Transcript_1235/g.1560 Transcript_1235/m.1560 type:complete len:223 (-) Transcript_1235:89-757(-)